MPLAYEWMIKKHFLSILYTILMYNYCTICYQERERYKAKCAKNTSIIDLLHIFSKTYIFVQF